MATRITNKPTSVSTTQKNTTKDLAGSSTVKKTVSVASGRSAVKKITVTKTPAKKTGATGTSKSVSSRPLGVSKAIATKAPAIKRTRGAISRPPISKSNPATPTNPATLTFDIGGTGLKASLVSVDGKMLHDRVRIPTPYPCLPEVLLENLITLSQQLPKADRVAVGFPGVVRNGVILTAPNLSLPKGPGKSKKPSNKIAALYNGFNLKARLEERLKLQVHVVNDADLAGAGAIKGRGLEVVVTLGTGFGTGMFYDGKLLPHLEIAHLVFKDNKTFDEVIGDAARKSMKLNKWSKLVLEALDVVYSLTHFDHLYLGGGNATRLTVDLRKNVSTITNMAAIKGGPKIFDAI